MKENNPKIEIKPRCGIIMPISSLDGYSEAHWVDVRDILFDAIEEAGFEPNLVSDADDVGIIQKRIIQNIYENPIVVCDVSGKNPNVMFELGMRLAFDKPTIIIKDNITSYSFDTSPIEHIPYPRDLRFNNIVEFKTDLIDKIKGTHKRAINDPEYTTFLKHFGNFTVAKIDTKEVHSTEYILEELQNIRKSMTDLVTNRPKIVNSKSKKSLCLQKASSSEAEMILSLLEPFGQFNLIKKGPTHYHFDSPNWDIMNWEEILRIGKTIVSTARIFPIQK